MGGKGREVEPRVGVEPAVQTFMATANDAGALSELKLFALVIVVHQVRKQLVYCNVTIVFLNRKHVQLGDEANLDCNWERLEVNKLPCFLV
jgi:hypothetical protein